MSEALENFPCTRDMLDKGILPYANTVWAYGKENPGADLVNVPAKEVMMCLLLGNGKTGCKTTRHIRENRKKEQQRKHRDFVREYENISPDVRGCDL